MNIDKISRVEVITNKGREFVFWGSPDNIEIQLQDNGRTLKIFVTESNEKLVESIFRLSDCCEAKVEDWGSDLVCSKCDRACIIKV